AEKRVSKFARPGHWRVPTFQPRASRGGRQDHRVTMPPVAQECEFPIDAESKECVLFLWRARFVWPCTLARPPARWTKQGYSHAKFKISLGDVQVNISSFQAHSRDPYEGTLKLSPRIPRLALGMMTGEGGAFGGLETAASCSFKQSPPDTSAALP